MTTHILPFMQANPLSQRVVFHCRSCESRTFKIAMIGFSEDLFVECANCEELQSWVEATIIIGDDIDDELEDT